MEDGSISRREVALAYRNGLHLTPIQLLVKRSSQFECDLRVCYDGKTANAKSAMDLLLLGATHGAVLTLEASGVDSEKALDAAAEVLQTEKEVEGSA